jgi:hypothetical protein
MYIFVMRARIGLKTLPIDRKWFCTYVVGLNDITKRFHSLVASLNVSNDWHIFRFILFPS